MIFYPKVAVFPRWRKQNFDCTGNNIWSIKIINIQPRFKDVGRLHEWFTLDYRRFVLNLFSDTSRGLWYSRPKTSTTLAVLAPRTRQGEHTTWRDKAITSRRCTFDCLTLVAGCRNDQEHTGQIRLIASSPMFTPVGYSLRLSECSLD